MESYTCGLNSIDMAKVYIGLRVILDAMERRIDAAVVRDLKAFGDELHDTVVAALNSNCIT